MQQLERHLRIFEFYVRSQIAREHQHWHLCTQRLVQQLRRLYAGLAISQLEIGDKQIRHALIVRYRPQCFLPGLAALHQATPVAQQQHQPLQHGRFVVDHHHVRARNVLGLRGTQRLCLRTLAARHQRQAHRETRAAAKAGIEIERVPGEPVDTTAHDCKSQAKAGLLIARTIGMGKLGEHVLLLRGVDARAGIADRQLRFFAERDLADDHAALAGVLDRIGDQVAQCAPEQNAIGAREQRPSAAQPQTKCKPFLPRQWFELGVDLFEQLADVVFRQRCFNAAGVEPAQVENRVERGAKRFA